MRVILPLIVTVGCIVLLSIPVGIVVCMLGAMTGSVPVTLAAGGLGVSFVFYCGYRAGAATLKEIDHEPPAERDSHGEGPE